MSTLQKTVTAIASKGIKPLLTPQFNYLVNCISVIVIVYSIVHLPHWVKNVLDTVYARFILSALSLYIHTNNPVTSVLVAGIFTILYEAIIYNQEGFTLIEPDTDSSPHCAKVTKKDLLDIFENDEEKLKKAMYEAGVPLNLHLTDSNAPEIATYLVSSGKDVSDSCAAINFKA